MSDYRIVIDEKGIERREPLPLEEYCIIMRGCYLGCIDKPTELRKWINPNDDPENVFMYPNTLFRLPDGNRIAYQKSRNGIEGCYTLICEKDFGKRVECHFSLLKVPQISPNVWSQPVWSDMCARKGIFKFGKFRNGVRYIPTTYETFIVPKEGMKVWDPELEQAIEQV